MNSRWTLTNNNIEPNSGGTVLQEIMIMYQTKVAKQCKTTIHTHSFMFLSILDYKLQEKNNP